MDKLAFLIMLTSFYMFFISYKIKEVLLGIIALILFLMSVYLFLFELKYL